MISSEPSINWVNWAVLSTNVGGWFVNECGGLVRRGIERQNSPPTVTAIHLLVVKLHAILHRSQTREVSVIDALCALVFRLWSKDRR